MKIKICGITNSTDAEHAAKAGADYIGINFSRLSKRYVTQREGIDIAKAAIANGAEPVAVFVEETLEDIIRICSSTNIKMLQLHGNASKSCLHELITDFSIIYAHGINPDGSLAQSSNIEMQVPEDILPLYDYLKGGSGKCFNWKAFTPPEKSRWILAGGLNPNNVCEAITLLNPYGVDVASGVESESRKKDPVLISKFIQNVRLLETKL